jgi:hypothetical protein
MGVIINGGTNIGSGGILISSPYIIPNDYIGPICVSGAGSTEVNGTYVFNGYTTDGGYTRPFYQYESAPFTFYAIDLNGGGSTYRIYAAFGDQNSYYKGNTFPPPANPYLETSWTLIESGTDPVPTVTIGPC